MDIFSLCSSDFYAFCGDIAGVCRTCLTGDKTITFYSKEIPANTIKIQVTLFSKTA